MSHPHKISVTDAVRDFSELINRVYYRRDRYILTKGSRLVASLEPLPAAGSLKLKDFPSLLSSLPRLSERERKELITDIQKGSKSLRAPKDQWDT